MTDLLYLEDSYLTETVAKVLKVETHKQKTTVTLDQTILFPQGGGQLADTGSLVGADGSLAVTSVRYRDGVVQHSGKLTGTLRQGEHVEVRLDWDTRYLHMQQHTAGHILDEAVKEVLPEHAGVKGCHGIDNAFYIRFAGIIDESEKGAVQSAIKEIIALDEPIQTRRVTADEIEAEGIYVPFQLPKDKPLRLIQIGERGWQADGGTQLARTGEAWPIRIQSFDYDEGQTTIHYTVNRPKTVKKTSNNTIKTMNLDAFTSALNELVSRIESQSDLSQKDMQAVLGKKGELNAIAAGMRDIDNNDKKAAGQALNAAKQRLTELLSSTDSTAHEQWVDVTRPGKQPAVGHMHPITQAIHEIQQIFETIGFTRVRYPEVDWDHYVFESLNMPPDHPARDEWETFFVDVPHHQKMGKMVLTTHTSNGQVREMERVGKPPIRMLNIAKCYRRQQDVTHTAMFHQFEGLVIDKGITIQHLKGSLDYFAKKFYGPTAKSRIRPFMFKFTEPSFEVDFSCTHCDGNGMQANGEKCRFCKAGWHEVGGSGMVHPNVLRAGGIDPDVYTGFAFGWGVERVYTLKPGLELDDIRPLYGNNTEFLGKF